MSAFPWIPHRGWILFLCLAMGVPLPVRAVNEAWSTPPGLQADPALAGRGAETVALWTDARVEGESRLYWTRLPGGWPDFDAAPVTSLAEGERHATVAAEGDWILAAWEAWSAAGGVLRAAVLPPQGPSGTVTPVAVSAGPGPVRRPSAAMAGDMALLLWEDERYGPGDIYIARWHRAGGLLDPGGVPMAAGPEACFRPRVAPGGGGFAAVWSEGAAGSFGIRWRAFAPDGTPGASAFVATGAATDLAPDMAWSEDRWLLVWREGAGSASARGIFLDAAGGAMGPAWDLLPPGHEVLDWKAAGWEGGVWLVWLEHHPEGRSLHRGLLDRNGVLHPAEGLEVAPPSEGAADPALTLEEAALRIAWRRPDPGDEDDLYMIHVPRSDTTSTPCPLPLTLVDPGVLGEVPSGAPPRPGFSAHPNPFRNRVRLALEGPEPEGAGVEVEIFDVRGRRLRHLAAHRSGEWTWDGKDEEGKRVPPGVYFVRAGTRSLRLVRVPHAGG